MALALLAALALLGCDRLALPGWLPGRPVTQLDGTTQSTPLVVGQVVDAAGHPVAGARVRIYEGLQIRLDGVTQSTPLEGVTQSTPLASTGSAGLDGVTQSTPLDGVTQSTPLDGVTQSTPLDGTTQSTSFDGVTQTTPLQVVGESGPDGAFAIRVPDRSVLSVEASSGGGDKAAILNVAIDRAIYRVDVGRLALDKPGAIEGKVVGPAGLDLAGTAVFVPGTDLVARADGTGAYEIHGIPARIVAVAAVRPKYRPAIARGLSILPGKVTPAPDLLLVPEKPRLDAIEPDNAGPGAVVALRGADFGAAFTPIEVRFGSLKASRLQRTGDGTLLATVPAGARGGPVVVMTDGVASNPLPFTVVASVSLTPEATRTLAGTAVPLQIRAFDTNGNAISSPALNLAIDPPDLGTLEAGLVFRPSRPGFGRLTATTGGVQAHADLGFGEWTYSTVLAPADLDNPASGPIEGAAGAVRFWAPTALRVLHDGSVVFLDSSTAQPAPLILPSQAAYPPTMVRRLADGQVRVLLGTGNLGYDGDGRPLLASRVSGPEGLAVGPPGTLLLTDFFNFRVRAAAFQEQQVAGRGLLAGSLWDLAGTGERGPRGNGLPGPDGPALTATLGTLGPIVWDPAGSAVFVEGASELGAAGLTRVREIGPSGVVRTIVEPAGPGPIGADPIEPVQSPRDFRVKVLSLACDTRSNVYMGTLSGIWMLCRRSGDYFGVRAEAGQIVRLAGTGTSKEFNGEEGQARQVSLHAVEDLAFLGNSLLVLEAFHFRVRQLEPSGRLRTITGGGLGPLGTIRNSTQTAAEVLVSARDVAKQGSGLGILALLGEPKSLAVSGDGAVYVADSMTHRILCLTR